MRFVFRFDDPKPLIFTLIVGIFYCYGIHDKLEQVQNGLMSWRAFQGLLVFSSIFIAGSLIYPLTSYIKWVPDDRVDNKQGSRTDG